MIAPPRRLAILAQYDAEGGLPAHVRIHLERLRPVAERVVLVSNSPLSRAARATADAVSDHVIERENKGWDFAAWRDSLAMEDIAAWDAVVLTNSSVVGPLYPLAPVFAHMERRRVDFWGMVHSRHLGSHLQSYFLAFNRRVITSDTWNRFWRGVEHLEEKTAVIRSYEVGLTEVLRRGAFTFDSLVEDPKFPRSIRLVRSSHLKRLRVPMDVNYVNKTKELHYQLIREGMPYLKASLLWGKDAHRRVPLERIKNIPGVDYPWAEIGF